MGSARVAFALAWLVLVAGCHHDRARTESVPRRRAAGDMPVFSLAWSEYPSRSMFGLAEDRGLIDGEAGYVGRMEEAYGVDIVLMVSGYAPSLERFVDGTCDAVCMTNVDALIASETRECVAVLPTSTSDGADACVVVNVDTLDDLRHHTVFGLDRSVSRYCFLRCLEQLADRQVTIYRPEDFAFVHQDPGAAAVAIQRSAATHQALMAWNPFVLQTLKDRPGAKVLFDSSLIPDEIIDLVVVGKDVLERPDADNFVRSLIATFYKVHEALEDPRRKDERLVALGRDFSNLDAEQMRVALRQTKLLGSPRAAISLVEDPRFTVAMQHIEEMARREGWIADPSWTLDVEGTGRLVIDLRWLKQSLNAGTAAASVRRE